MWWSLLLHTQCAPTRAFVFVDCHAHLEEAQASGAVTDSLVSVCTATHAVRTTARVRTASTARTVRFVFVGFGFVVLG